MARPRFSPVPAAVSKAIHDVARRAGVSAATASRIARGQLSVDAAIQARVRRGAAELGLDLDRKRNRTSTIVAFLLSNREVLHSFQARILAGAEAYCASQEKELLFMSPRCAPTVPPERY